MSRGILDILAAGRLSAISVMVTRPNWRAAARRLNEAGKEPDLGLHLNLTLGGPLTEMPGLAPNGSFPSFAKLASAAGPEGLPHLELAREIAAQLYAFAVGFGRFPDFIAGHQHVHVLPGVRRALFQVLQDKGLIRRLWLRDPGDSFWRILRRGGQIRKALAITRLAKPFVAEAHLYGYAVNDGCSGLESPAAGANYAAEFDRFLVAPGTAHLIICHPGHADAELTMLDPKLDLSARAREKQRAFLLAPQFPAALAKRNAELGRLTQQLDR